MSKLNMLDVEKSKAVSFYQIDCGSIPVTMNLSVFRTDEGAVELNLMAEATAYDSLAVQLQWLEQAYAIALAKIDTDTTSTVIRRLFCSDPVNQSDLLKASALWDPDTCVISCVGQPPIGPAKVALWAYHVIDADQPLQKQTTDTTLVLKRGELTHLWLAGKTAPKDRDSYPQTQQIFNQLDTELSAHQMNLADHVVRTWFYVRDIDVNYQGLVDARREIFQTHGLTQDTHYMASSGIGGESIDPQATVLLDAWAIAGIKPEQIEYLNAPQYLSPTHVYGVTFERATSIAYQDRKHILISGTASIDHEGQIVHPGNIALQLERTIQNIEALLQQAHATLEQMTHWIVYLRDANDEPLVRKYLDQKLGPVPMVIVYAPVCRPGWLVEIEGIAITKHDDEQLPMY